MLKLSYSKKQLSQSKLKWLYIWRLTFATPPNALCLLSPDLNKIEGEKESNIDVQRLLRQKGINWISAGCSHKNGYNVISLSRLTLMHLFEQKIFKYHYHIKKRQERIIDILSEPIYLKVLSYYFLSILLSYIFRTTTLWLLWAFDSELSHFFYPHFLI